MTYGQPSGTSNYNPVASSLFLDAFERLGIYNPGAQHMQSANRSANLVLASMWSNRGINLWKIDQVPLAIDLLPGVATYALDADIIDILDVYIRTPVDVTLTTGTQTGIIPYLIGDPVSTGAILTTTEGSPIVNVYEVDHGRSAFDQVSILAPVVVGGLTLGGVYTVQTVVDADNYTINATFNATSTASSTNNAAGGMDTMLAPISRWDYAALPQKNIQAKPTCYYYDRQRSPFVTVWPVPPSTPIFQLQAYAFRQVQDIQGSNGQTPDIPVRFLEAFTADLAAHLAVKWAPDKYALLAQISEKIWADASNTDTERTTLTIVPQMPSGLR